jgi:hypothetical protein
MDAHLRAWEALAVHPRAEKLSPRSALAILAMIHAARGQYPTNLAECIGWGIDLLARERYLRESVEQEGPEQWAYQLRLAGLRPAQDAAFSRRLDRAAAEIVASLADVPQAVAGFYVSPQDILDYMNRVNLAADLFNEDVRRSGIQKRDGAFYWGWNDWLVIWRQFYNEHLPWYARLSGSVHDETEVKERELIEWRKKFESLGEKPTSPDPQGPGAGGGSGDDPSLGDIGMTLARGAIVVAGIGVVTYMVLRKP